MIDHRVGDLAIFKLLFYFLSFFFFLLGTEALSKGLHAASVTSACSSLFDPPPFFKKGVSALLYVWKCTRKQM
jgi:hypothetical protein